VGKGEGNASGEGERNEEVFLKDMKGLWDKDKAESIARMTKRKITEGKKTSGRGGGRRRTKGKKRIITGGVQKKGSRWRSTREDGARGKEKLEQFWGLTKSGKKKGSQKTAAQRCRR